VAELPDVVQTRTVWRYAAYETPRVPGGENRAGRLTTYREWKQGPVSVSQEKHSVSPGEYGAWLFDLDGVITDTASAHAAWKRMFDEYLKEVSEREGRPFEPYEIDPDYHRYVDGRPRYPGVDSFLRSRGIIVDWGNPNDPPGRETVCRLANRKNALFNKVLGVRAGRKGGFVIGVAGATTRRSSARTAPTSLSATCRT